MADDDDRVDEFEEAELPMNTETLLGDVRAALLQHMKGWEEPWSKLNERQQQRRIDDMDRLAERLVRQTVLLVAHQGFDHIVVDVGGFKVDKGIEAKVTAPNLVENITALAEHGKRQAVLVLAGVAQFMGARSAPKAEPDQSALDLDDDAGERDEQTAIQAAAAAMGVDGADDEAVGEPEPVD